MAAPLQPDPLRAESLERLAGSNVAITGGAGFVGLNLVHALAGNVASVRVLDDGSTGDLDALRAIPDVSLIHGTVLDESLLAELVDGADLVFHLACRNIIVSLRDPEEDLMVNAFGTLRLLKAAVAAGVQRVIYTSTASVYGNARHLPVDEEDPKSLLNPYAVSKHAAEGYCRVMAEAEDLPFSILRYSNVYGPWQTPSNPYCGVIGKFMASALAGETLRIHGDGEQTRDFTYVDDAISATIAAGWKQQSVGRVYNIASGRETSVNDLARLVLARSGGDPESIEWIDKRGIDNIRRRVLNIERIRQDLRWMPRYTLERGVDETLAWMREHDAATV